MVNFHKLNKNLNNNLIYRYIVIKVTSKVYTVYFKQYILLCILIFLLNYFDHKALLYHCGAFTFTKLVNDDRSRRDYLSRVP